jgi:uncharacterized protein YydD (DUF2326 family)
MSATAPPRMVQSATALLQPGEQLAHLQQQQHPHHHADVVKEEDSTDMLFTALRILRATDSEATLNLQDLQQQQKQQQLTDVFIVTAHDHAEQNRVNSLDNALTSSPADPFITEASFSSEALLTNSETSITDEV